MIYFADTFYFLARLNPTDRAHAKAILLPVSPQDELSTTEWILMELADGLSDSRNRNVFGAIYDRLRTLQNVRIIEANHALFTAAVDLFKQRPDKNWSLTDCSSFVVMNQFGVTHALTADHHFEQAGLPLFSRIKSAPFDPHASHR